MKTLVSLSALLITLTLNAQSNPATWFLNDTSVNGIQSETNTASGDRSTSMGSETKASGDFSTAAGKGSNASGERSTAIGNWPLAAGPYSTALGYYTKSNGISSTAFGDSTIANGNWSTVTGAYTTASGDFSTAMGFYTTASDYNSLVVGRYNLLGSTVTNSSTGYSTENTAFIIGNGTNENNRSDALTVLYDGTTNVAGSVTATAFVGDGSQLTNLNFSTLGPTPFSINETPVVGHGIEGNGGCLLYTSPSPRDQRGSRIPGCC